MYDHVLWAKETPGVWVAGLRGTKEALVVWGVGVVAEGMAGSVRLDGQGLVKKDLCRYLSLALA